MELITFPGQKRYILIAVAALIILGLGTMTLTWQNLRQGEKAVRMHLLLSARSISGGIEAAMGRGMHRMQNRESVCPPHGRGDRAPYLHSLRPVLKDLISSKGLSFVQISGPAGDILVSPFEESAYTLPPEAISALNKGDSWHSRTILGDKPVFVYASRLGPDFAERHGFGDIKRKRRRPILVIGLDMRGHIRQFDQFRTNAILQTGFVLAVAVFLLLGTAAYLQHRERGRKARSLEKFHSSLLDTLPDGLLTLDKNGQITSANPAALEIFGSSSADLLGSKWTRLDLRNKDGQALQELPGNWTRYHTENRDLEILAVPVNDENKTTLLIVCDRSQLIGLERRLEQARRFATIGQMAAGLAHEIRNPLSTLRGFSQFFASKFPAEDPAREYAQTMVKEADRLNRVVTDLLFMAKPGRISPQETDIAEAIREVTRLLKLDIEAKSVKIDSRIKGKCVHADRDALIRILVNLVLNSLDAMDPGGEITISTAAVQSGTRLQVADNGHGMDEQTRKKALEPFYTGKDRGTGLGLALVHRLVSEHGGTVHINSIPGAGTKVILFFPDNAQTAIMGGDCGE
jgi:PAS domain S-box-containing protein